MVNGLESIRKISNKWRFRQVRIDQLRIGARSCWWFWISRGESPFNERGLLFIKGLPLQNPFNHQKPKPNHQIYSPFSVEKLQWFLRLGGFLLWFYVFSPKQKPRGKQIPPSKQDRLKRGVNKMGICLLPGSCFFQGICCRLIEVHGCWVCDDYMYKNICIILIYQP